MADSWPQVNWDQLDEIPASVTRLPWCTLPSNCGTNRTSFIFFVKYFYKDGSQNHRIITNSENLWQTWPHCSDKADQVILWPFELVCGKMQRYLQLWVSKATTCKQSIIVQISLDKMLRKMEFQRGAMNFFLNWAKGNNYMMCS